MAAVHGGRRIIQTPGWTETAKASRLGQLHMVGHRALISNLGVVWQIVEMLQTKLVLTGGARTQVRARSFALRRGAHRCAAQAPRCSSFWTFG